MLAIHEAQIAEHGGALGIRDRGLLESALGRPRHAASYRKSKARVPELGALYTLGIVGNHPFVDGNKRVGLVLLELFLNLNGYELTASDSECYKAIYSLAAGKMTNDAFIGWVQKHVRKSRRN